MHQLDRPAVGVALLLACGLVLGGCGGDGSGPRAPEGAGLERYPEAEGQILAYYASQGAGEPSFNCDRGRIETIDHSRIVTDTPVEVIFEVTYRFSATTLGASNLPCFGATTRWFTFDREADGRLSLAEMADAAP